MTADILRLPTVSKTVGLSRSTIYDMMAKGRFPQPIRLSERSVGWLRAEIESWIESRIAATRGTQAS